MEQNMETLSSVNAPGDASFNAADRLAIINLFGAYAQSYDAGKTDEFLSVWVLARLGSACVIRASISLAQGATWVLARPESA